MMKILLDHPNRLGILLLSYSDLLLRMLPAPPSSYSDSFSQLPAQCSFGVFGRSYYEFWLLSSLVLIHVMYVHVTGSSRLPYALSFSHIGPY